MSHFLLAVIRAEKIRKPDPRADSSDNHKKVTAGFPAVIPYY